MIQDLPVPDYYVEGVDINVEPKEGETIPGQVAMDFEMSDPEYNEYAGGFRCQASLDMQLFTEGNAPWQVEGEDDTEQFGEASMETVVFVPGPHSRFEEYIETWDANGYEALDEEFIYHLESGILQHVITPIGDLLSNSYSGVVPRMIFTPRFDEQDANEETPTGNE